MSKDPEMMVHCNFGWRGRCNGYYTSGVFRSCFEMIRLFSYGPFRPFSSLSSVEYLQYTPSSKVETASKNPHNKIRKPFQNSFLVM